jgi:N-methylhydantoinase A
MKRTRGTGKRRNKEKSTPYKIGVDVGGTFTDVSLLSERDCAFVVHKVPSTPEDPSKAIMNGILEILQNQGISPDRISYLAHGTTVATNAIIEHKGGKVGLLTTKGFRDLLEIGRQTRPRLYDLQLDYPPPLVPRDLRLEVEERMRHTGEIAIPLDEVMVRGQVAQLKKDNVDAVVICLLYSYINPSHEARIREMVKEDMPEVYISVSHEVLPEFREYERLSTATLNAFLMPVMHRYLQNFQREVKGRGIHASPRINQCNGGVMSVETACKFPIRTALSGPSAGVTGAHFIGDAIHKQDLITFDMGGTSTDVCLLEQGVSPMSNDRWVGGYPAKIPSIDVNAVGAGGGSIAWVDLDGLMKVGPRSAGASPGPVCYDLGGTEPTVTDANVVLGRLNPEYLLGGRMKINRSKAEASLRQLGRQLGVECMETAHGVIKIVTAHMVKAIRAISIERGYDPKEFSLIAFGGAGPLHAVGVARELEISEVIVPANPGILCAAGLLVADARNDYVKTFLMDTDGADIDHINQIFQGLENEACQWLSDEGFDSIAQKFFRSVDMRYIGQNFELPVAVPGGSLSPSNIESLICRFYQEHERNYGHFTPGEPTQLVNFRVTAQGINPKLEVGRTRRKKGPGPAITAEREVYFDNGNPVPTPVYDRAKLPPGHRIVGPAVIEQMDSTTLVFPGDEARIDEALNVIITIT